MGPAFWIRRFLTVFAGTFLVLCAVQMVFKGQDLADILSAVANRSGAFVACEPRRDQWSHIASRLVGLVGGNHVTRSDAVSSVVAGFTGEELSRQWPDGSSWIIDETRAFPFTHLFSARAHAPAGDRA